MDTIFLILSILSIIISILIFMYTKNKDKEREVKENKNQKNYKKIHLLLNFYIQEINEIASEINNIDINNIDNSLNNNLFKLYSDVCSKLSNIEKKMREMANKSNKLMENNHYAVATTIPIDFVKNCFCSYSQGGKAVT